MDELSAWRRFALLLRAILVCLCRKRKEKVGYFIFKELSCLVDSLIIEWALSVTSLFAGV